MEEMFWFIGSILVLAAVSFSAAFEQIDHDEDREFAFHHHNSLAQSKILESSGHLLNEYNFWKTIHHLYYSSWITSISKESEQFMAKESSEYGKIVVALGDARMKKVVA